MVGGKSMQVRTKHHPRPTLILLAADSSYSMHCKSPNPVTSRLQQTYSLKNPQASMRPLAMAIITLSILLTGAVNCSAGPRETNQGSRPEAGHASMAIQYHRCIRRHNNGR